jgi:hypothetical protein
LGLLESPPEERRTNRRPVIGNLIHETRRDSGRDPGRMRGHCGQLMPAHERRLRYPDRARKLAELTPRGAAGIVTSAASVTVACHPGDYAITVPLAELNRRGKWLPIDS